MNELIQFSIAKISTEQFAILPGAYVNGKEINLSAGFRFGLNDEEKSVAIFALFKLEQEQNPFIIIEVGCHFKISEKSWNSFLDKEKGKIIIDKGFAIHLSTLTVGTARGVLHAKTEGSLFNQFLLPTINVTEVIKQDIELDMISEPQA